MLIDFVVEIPVANVIKLTQEGIAANKRTNFDDVRFAESEHTTLQQRYYLQQIEKTDPVRLQFYTNFPYRRVKIMDCDGNQYGPTLTPSLAVEYIGKKYRSDVKFTSLNGKLFIYYSEGFEYTDEDFEVQGNQVSWLGRLPNIRARVGDTLRYKLGPDFELTTIDSIAWNTTLQAEGFLTDIDSALIESVDGFLEITYDEKDANLYHQPIDFSALSEGIRYVVLEVGLTSMLYSFASEPIDLKALHEDSLAIDYRHNGDYDAEDLYSYIYLSNWSNILRMPASFFKFTPAGEVDVDNNDNGVPRRLRAVPYRQLSFEALNIPSWLADKLQVVFSHDTKLINDAYWENTDYGAYEQIDKTDLGTYAINMRQKNDRTKMVKNFEADLTASFTPPSIDAIPAGEVIAVVFNTNSGATFSFSNLPAWIVPDVPSFVNGQTINLTIGVNPNLFDRSIELIATTDQFTGLQATLQVDQTFTEPEPEEEYISVDDETVVLPSSGGNQLLNVVSSGDYDIIITGSHTFTAVKESGFLQVRISEATVNNTAATRTGNVRLRLQSNPAIFVDIAVSQPVAFFMAGLTPELDSIGSSGGTLEVDVNALGSAQWQASTLDSWLHVDTFIRTGNYFNFPVIVDGKPPYIPGTRTGSVKFTNILNSSDFKVYTVQQTD